MSSACSSQSRDRCGETRDEKRETRDKRRETRDERRETQERGHQALGDRILARTMNGADLYLSRVSRLPSHSYNSPCPSLPSPNSSPRSEPAAWSSSSTMKTAKTKAT